MLKDFVGMDGMDIPKCFVDQFLGPNMKTAKAWLTGLLTVLDDQVHGFMEQVSDFLAAALTEAVTDIKTKVGDLTKPAEDLLADYGMPSLQEIVASAVGAACVNAEEKNGSDDIGRVMRRAYDSLWAGLDAEIQRSLVVPKIQDALDAVMSLAEGFVTLIKSSCDAIFHKTTGGKGQGLCSLVTIPMTQGLEFIRGPLRNAPVNAYYHISKALKEAAGNALEFAINASKSAADMSDAVVKEISEAYDNIMSGSLLKPYIPPGINVLKHAFTELLKLISDMLAPTLESAIPSLGKCLRPIAR